MNAIAFQVAHTRRPQAPTDRQRIDRRLSAVASVLLVLGGHLLWYKVATHAVLEYGQGNGAMASAPQVSFLGAPVSETGEGPDVRLVRSPILMSLPTRIGFSGPNMGRANLVEAPAFRGPPPDFIRTLDQPFQAAPFGETVRSLSDLVRAPRPLAAPSVDDGPVRLPAGRPPAATALAVYWLDQPDPGARTLDAASVAGWAGDKAWDAVILVCADVDGWIEQVMLEKAAPDPGVNAFLLRQARVWAAEEPPAGCGRMAVRYRPPPREGTAAP